MHLRTHCIPYTLRIASAIAALATAGVAHAAGPWITETGGTDMGLSGASRAATAFDAAAVAGNPATLATLEHAAITAAIVPLELDFEFRGTGGFAASSTNQSGPTVLPAVFAVDGNERWKWGVGAHSRFGLEFDLGEDWGGQHAVERAGLVTYDVGTAVAWQATDRLRVGGSLVAQWARTEVRMAVANDWLAPGQQNPDGRLRIEGDDWAPGGQVGATFEPHDGVSIGASWTAAIEHNAPLHLEGHGVHPALVASLPAVGVARLEFALPQQVLVGAAHRGSDGTTVAGGVTWQDWSRFGDARLVVPGAAAPLFPDGLVDTWGVAFGARRKFENGWTASAGAGYESSPAPRKGVPVYFPAAAQWKLSFGVERQVTESARLRGTASVILQGDATVNQHQHPLPLPGIPDFTGRFEGTRVYALGLAADFAL